MTSAVHISQRKDMAPDNIETEIDELRRRVEALEKHTINRPQYGWCQRCKMSSMGPTSIVRGEQLCPSHALQAVNETHG